MNPNPDPDRVFPLSGGSSERAALRPPRLSVYPRYATVPIMGHRAFLRAWAARRAARLASAQAAGKPAETAALAGSLG
ncbi:MAG: hypothetical protein Q7S40_10960 [Opitutaceae bacterium]|nr:hypothetical protein [Opitutaceae bacterium]